MISLSTQNPPAVDVYPIVDGGQQIGVLYLGDDWHYAVTFPSPS